MILTFTGDTSITGSFIQKIKSDTEIFSPIILERLKSSDWVVSNLEGPVTNATTIIDSSTKIKSPIETIKYLSKRNISIFNLANNHILDARSKGLKDSIDEITKNQCLYFGASLSNDHLKPLILEKGNIKIGLISFSDTTNNQKSENGRVASNKDIKQIKKKIEVLKKTTNYIIINFHGGEEYTRYPSPTKRKLMKKIAKIEAVDVIIGHHSHTLQTYEKYSKTHIFYSLGNFIFDIPNHENYLFTKESSLVTFKFTKEKIIFKWTPYLIKKARIVDQRQVKFTKTLKEISKLDNYKKQWRKEAYRVLFRKGTKREIKTDSIKQKSLQEKSILKLITNRRFYRKAFSVLYSNNYRSLYISATIHRIINPFKSH